MINNQLRQKNSKLQTKQTGKMTPTALEWGRGGEAATAASSALSPSVANQISGV